MYRVPAFDVRDVSNLHALIRERPLGLLVTGGPDGPLADLAPFLLDPDAGSHGVLRAHLARANPQVGAIAVAGRALVVFRDADAYVSPSAYPSKQAHGRVVPTWNYAMAQARGPARIVEDAAWVRAQVAALTHGREASRPSPWGIEDAPEDFLEAMLRQIVGVEITIDSLVGKWKVSQNRDAADRAGVVAELNGGDADARAVAAMVEARGPRPR